MGRPLKFRKRDYFWIKNRFPKFYKLLKDTAHIVNDEVYVEVADQGAYDIIFDGTAYVLMDEVTDDGELTKDGLRFEEAWDYADREGKPIGETKK
ncbi:hypothetical protein [Ligilactobacillus agilis]|uniref:hypothetical protein n=1 Tax=Ligilactobacillus agilis TaxID=1601 RepID=UPI0022E43F06|nr:hypothetical protein [Ligilactobacillus agilis]